MITNGKNMKILDCTLRDGGYYNNWDFEPEVVRAYLSSMASAKINFVELGLRNFPQARFLGAFAYTTEAYLNSLHLPEGPIYGVMVDAKTILNSDLSVDEAIGSLFVSASESKIGLVRVAAHFDEIQHSEPIVNKLKGLGYIVGFNMMQAGGKSNAIVSEKAKIASAWDGLDVLYFADSLGNMDAKEILRIIKAIRHEWDGPIGIHTHDNMGKGLENTMTANAAGVSWLDSTVTGMGRGAGNTQTESLLAVLGESNYNSKSVYELVVRHFEKMKKESGWGTSLLYFLGAQNEVHPTYIQNLLSNTHYGTDEIVGAISYLSNLDGTASYNDAIFDTALDFSDAKRPVSGSKMIAGMFDDENVLVITNAPSTDKYSSAIELYIKQFNPKVISINIVDAISADLIDYYIISHNSKFLSDAKKYNKISKPIILPMHRFKEGEINTFSGGKLIDFGLKIKANFFDVHETYVTAPYDITTAYALGVLLQSKVNSVKVIGFDGYEANDPRQLEMNEIISYYENYSNCKSLTALTPTSYAIKKGSIYAPVG